MSNQTSGSVPTNTFKEVMNKFGLLFSYLKSKWLLIGLCSFIFSVFGFIYAAFQPVKFISKLTFVVVEGKGGSGGLSSIAGQFGIDLGGSTGGGFFSADNILLFLESKSLIRETLLTNYGNEKDKTLADQFAIVTGKKKQWLKDEKLGQIDFFKFQNSELPRKHDSLLQKMIKQIIEKNLIVTRPDKKATFIEVKVEMQDEKLAKLFADRLVAIATQRYISSKSKTKTANIQKLEARADSLAALLNDKIYQSASTQQVLVDVNPALRITPIAAEISARDKAMAATLYAEVVKNLEVSRTLLSQDMPVIEIVDNSNLPLEIKKSGKVVSAILAGMIGFFICCFYLSFRFILKNLTN